MIIEELDYLYSYEYYELAVMNGTMSLYTPYTDREVYAVIKYDGTTSNSLNHNGLGALDFARYSGVYIQTASLTNSTYASVSVFTESGTCTYVVAINTIYTTYYLPWQWFQAYSSNNCDFSSVGAVQFTYSLINSGFVEIEDTGLYYSNYPVSYIPSTNIPPNAAISVTPVPVTSTPTPSTSRSRYSSASISAYPSVQTFSASRSRYPSASYSYYPYPTTTVTGYYYDVEIIDNFSNYTSPLIIIAQPSIQQFASGYTISSTILGDQRDIILFEDYANVDTVFTAGTNLGVFYANAPYGGEGSVSLQYDGMDTNIQLNQYGLGGYDFTCGGECNALRLQMSGIFTSVKITVYTHSYYQAENCDYYITDISTSMKNYIAEFNAFSNLCDWANVGALQITANLQSSGDISINEITLCKYSF